MTPTGISVNKSREKERGGGGDTTGGQKVRVFPLSVPSELAS